MEKEKLGITESVEAAYVSRDKSSSVLSGEVDAISCAGGGVLLF